MSGPGSRGRNQDGTGPRPISSSSSNHLRIWDHEKCWCKGFQRRPGAVVRWWWGRDSAVVCKHKWPKSFPSLNKVLKCSPTPLHQDFMESGLDGKRTWPTRGLIRLPVPPAINQKLRGDPALGPTGLSIPIILGPVLYGSDYDRYH